MKSGAAATGPLFADSPLEQRRGAWRYAPGSGDVPLAAAAARTPWWHWIALSVITLLGGAIRFAWLDRPPVWGDEVATYARTFGSYENLLNTLGVTRFMPLHYQALWGIGQWRELTPFYLRLFPAVCGTLMIPAMYFLARQLLTRRASLVCALFTAGSAYLFVYSRDAKMYMPLWFAMALNLGCFLWWMRTRTVTAWLAWIATGLAAGGLHLTGLAGLGLAPLLLLTQRRAHWGQGLMFLVGLAVILAGPIGYYIGFNPFVERIQERGWRSTGITWVEHRNQGLGATELTLDSATLYLTAYGWIPETAGGRVPEVVYDTAVIITAVVFLLLALGALPWTARWRGARADDPPTQPWWRTALWVGILLILPVFAMYWLSLPERIHPIRWVEGAAKWMGEPWLRSQPRSGDDSWRIIGLRILETRVFLIASGLVLVAAMTLLWRYIPRALTAAVAMALVILLLIAGMRVNLPDPLAILREWGAMLLEPSVLMAGLILIPALLWYYGGGTLRERFTKSAVAIGVIAGWWGICWLTAEAILQVRPDRLDGSVWMPRYLGFIWPAVALAAAALLTRLPSRPLRYAAIAVLLGINLAQSYGRVMIGNEPPVDRVAADVRADYEGETTLTFVGPLRNTEHVRFTGSPGTPQIFSLTGRYYLSLGDPRIERFEHIERADMRRLWGLRPSTEPSSIRNVLDQNPQTTHIVVWEQLDLDRADSPAPDPVLDMLGASWAMNDEQIYHVRFYWTWGDFYDYRRREYVRQIDPITEE